MLLKNPLALATGSFIQSLISFYLFRVNDTEEIESHRRRILISSWCLVVLLPLLLLVSWLYLGQGHPSALLFLLILGAGVVFAMRRTVDDSLLHLTKTEKEE